LSALLATTADPRRGFAEGVIEDLRPLSGCSLERGGEGWLSHSARWNEPVEEECNFNERSDGYVGSRSS